MITVTSVQSLWQEIEGKRIVLIPLNDYEALTDRLEELEDSLELRQAMAEATEFVPFNEMVTAIRAGANFQHLVRSANQQPVGPARLR